MHPLDQFTAATDHCDVRSGGLTMRGDYTELQIKGKVGGTQIDVVFKQTAAPLRPGSGYVFAGSTEKYFGSLSSRYRVPNENFVLVAPTQAATLRPTARRSASRSSQMR